MPSAADARGDYACLSRGAREEEPRLSEREVIKAVTAFAPLWDELFPAERARIVRLLVERVDMASDGIRVRLRVAGLHTLAQQLMASGKARAA